MGVAISAEVYPDLEEFWADLSAAYAAEIAGLAELGCTYLQLDDTSLAYLNDRRNVPSSPQQVRTASTSTCATSSR